jgi:DNA-binding CsgD family transcriptional regulator/predicted negative regulator of RcsB-dependent stress response
MARRADDARELARRVLEGESIVLSAPAGAGKSWVLLQVAEIVTARDARVIALHGSNAAAAIPLGLFASLLQRSFTGTDADPDAALFSAAVHVRGRLLAEADVVIVDQADSVDPASAGVLIEVAKSGIAVLIALRADPAAGSPFAVFLRSGVAGGFRLPLLDVRDLSAIIATVCPGPIDRRALGIIQEFSDGNGVAALELCWALKESGALRMSNGVWILDGDASQFVDLRGPTEWRLTALDPLDRETLEGVALAESIPLEEALRIWAEPRLERLEELGLLAVEGSTWLSLGIADSVVSEVLLRELPILRRRRLAGMILDSRGSDDATRSTDLARRLSTVQLLIDAGRPVPPVVGLEVASAIEAVAPVRAESILRALVAAEESTGEGAAAARLRLARFLVRLNRLDDASRALNGLRDHADREIRYQVDLVRIELLASTGSRTGEALDLVDRMRTEQLTLRSGIDPRVEVLHARVLLRSGRVREARTSGETLALDSGTATEHRAAAAVVACYSAIYLGDRTGYLRSRELLDDLAHSDPAIHLPDGAETLALVDAAAALMRGNSLADAMTIARDGYDRTLRRGDDGIRGQFAAERGWNATLQGDPREGVALLREAQALRGAWTPASRPWIVALYVQALALAGEVEVATQQMAQLATLARAPLYDLDVGVAHALLLVSLGSFDEARRAYDEVAERAVSSGHRYLARIAYYGAARLGDRRSAALLLALMDGHDGPADTPIRLHAEAILADDPAAIERAADALEDADLKWYAADAWGFASTCRRRLGDARGAALAAERGAAIERSGSLVNAVLRAVDRPRLTPREAQIVRLVAEGSSDRDVAERLGLSTRTVHSHLRRSYTKLGIASRSQLTALYLWPPGER